MTAFCLDMVAQNVSAGGRSLYFVHPVPRGHSRSNSSQPAAAFPPEGMLCMEAGVQQTESQKQNAMPADAHRMKDAAAAASAASLLVAPSHRSADNMIADKGTR